MKLSLPSGYLLILGLLASCQSTSPNIDTANAYLAALQEGDVQGVANLTCLTEPVEKEPAAPGIRYWKVIEETSETDARDPAGIYANVLAEIEYTGIASPVKDIFVLTVWKTDELYESNLRLAESINQFSRETDELIRRSNEILGEAIEPDTSDSEPLEPPSRDEFTNREYCVTQLRKPS